MNRPIGSGWPARRERLISATIMLARQRAGQSESKMKQGRKWTDRTGNARQGLHAGVELGVAARGLSLGSLAVTGGGSTRLRRIVLYLAHGMEYGKWLETYKGPAYGHRRSLATDVFNVSTGRAASISDSALIGPLAIIHPTARRIAPGYRAAVKRIWGRR